MNGSDRPRCTYCGAALSRKPDAFHAPREAEVQFFTQDHIIPKASGGVDHRRNLTAACHWCNTDRGHMPLDEFIEKLGARAVITVQRARQMMSDAKAVCDAIRYGGSHGAF